MDHIVSQITDYIEFFFTNVEANTVKNHLWVFVNALIDHPNYESGSKIQQKWISNNFESEWIEESTMLKGLFVPFGVFLLIIGNGTSLKYFIFL